MKDGVDSGGGTMRVKCVWCGEEFDKKNAEVRRTEYNACSKKCSGKYRSSLSVAEFLARLEPAENGCLKWTGSTNRYGYGQMRCFGKLKLTHRFAWEFKFGPIPDGLHVLHSCDNPACCNTDHLSLGTHDDNMRDMVKKNRHAHKVTDEMAREIRLSVASQEDLAKKLGVSARTIRNYRSSSPIEPPKESK